MMMHIHGSNIGVQPWNAVPFEFAAAQFVGCV